MSHRNRPEMSPEWDSIEWLDHLRYMNLAISLEQECKDEDGRKNHPKVGVVVVHNGTVTTAYRGEMGPGEHGEYTVIAKKLGQRNLRGATLYTTLEPCTTRRHPKRPCYQWILQAKIARVFIGILDPNPEICGIGEWVLKTNDVLVDRFPSDLQARIEDDKRDFVDEQRPKLLRRVETLRSRLSLEVPCAHCHQVSRIDVYTCEWGTNQAIDCPDCGKRYFLHLIGEEGDHFTTIDGTLGTHGIHPAEGLSLPIAIRRQLKKSQLWIEPHQLPGLLRLMKDTEASLLSAGPVLTPYALMQAMVASDELHRHRVTTKSIRQFFNYLVKRGYFIFEARVPGPIRYWPYRNRYEKEQAIRCYLLACLSILRRNRVVTSLQDAVAAYRYLLSDLEGDVEALATEHWREHGNLQLESPNGG